MTKVSVCGECKGEGSYFVYNAYDPDYKEEVICEYCDGEGVLDAAPRVVKFHKERDWVN